MLPAAPTGETGHNLNLQEAFNRLAPGLGDALAAANAKTDSAEKHGGARTATSHGQVNEIPSAGPLRTYNSTSPRARVDPYQATAPQAVNLADGDTDDEELRQVAFRVSAAWSDGALAFHVPSAPIQYRGAGVAMRC
eukprot:s913_g5.t1